MNRKYDTARYAESVRLLRHVFPRLRRHDRPDRRLPRRDGGGIRGSRWTLSATCGLAMIHIFPYSRRTGTPAAKMPDQSPERGQGIAARRRLPPWPLNSRMRSTPR